MFTVTEAASAQLHNMLEEASAPEGMVARFVVKGTKLNMESDTVQPGDVTFEHEGQTVLVLDEATSEALADRKLVVKETEEGPQLSFG